MVNLMVFYNGMVGNFLENIIDLMANIISDFFWKFIEFIFFSSALRNPCFFNL